MKQKQNKHLPFIVINVYHSMTLRNADPDLNENSDGSTDLGQIIARIRQIPIPLFTPLITIRKRDSDSSRSIFYAQTVSNASFIYSFIYPLFIYLFDLATISLPANYNVVEVVSRFLYAKIACSG